MNHYLITGGAGFIGTHLSEALLAQGHQVTIIDNLSTGRFDNIAHLVDHPRFHFAIETITNEVVMDRLVSECDIIYHLAAAVGVELIVRSPIHVIETNVQGTNVVLETARRYRKKTLIASTSEIYGKSDNVPFAEDDDRVLGATTRSRWSYSASKALDEFLALARITSVPTPAIDRLYPYLDAETPLMPAGSAEIPLRWGGTLFGLGVLAAALAVGVIMSKGLCSRKSQ